MSNQLESLARSFLASSKGSIPNMEKYMGILDSAEGKKLLQALSANGGDALKQSAQQAASGDAAATKRLISSLLSSKEGAALAAQVMAISKKK